MIEEQGVTSRTVSTRSETPSECSTTCGSPLGTAPRPSWRSTKAVWRPRYDMALSAGRRQRAKSPGCKSSTQRAPGESCESFGLTPSLANGYLPAAIKTAWRPSSCEGDGDGLGTSWGESRTTSLAQPFTKHLKERRRGHATHLGYHPEAGPEPTHVAILHSRPTCHTAWWARVSECAITILGHFFSFLLNVLVYTEYEQAYPDEIVVIIVAKMVIMYILVQTIIQIVMIVIRVAL